MNLTPLRNLIFVKPEPLKSATLDLSGLENNHTLSEKFNVSGVGIIAAVNRNSDFNVGDRVYFGPNVGLGCKFDDVNYLVMRDSDIDCLVDHGTEITCGVGHYCPDKR